jgi:RNA polymerase sigma-70 factor (ECF subfamily)
VRRRVAANEVADIVQDTYLRVLQYAEPRELENSRAYLYRVAANVSSDRGIALKKVNECIDADLEPDTLRSGTSDIEAQFEMRQQLQGCLSALDSLPEIYRHVFFLNRIDGMTQQEISVALDIPKRTVERYIAKALEHCLKRVG